ncbi:DUF2530 domain-containing protein [Longispora sp. K20-0274]|uniref:DUF2530 domain-containing protein n=1 Tax=Longispora sp. K20-0274 TaxID=3088255 RepID=UPI00399B00F3
MSTREEPQPLQIRTVPFAVAGIVLWALGGIGVLVFDGPAHWVRICVAGVLIGIPGLLTMIRHDRRERRTAG